MTIVRRGQAWKHRSGDVRTVHDIVTYAHAAGIKDPADERLRDRHTHVARLVQVRESDGWIKRDCRDSSDMELVAINGDGQAPFRPAYPSDWTLVEMTVKDASP